MTSEISGFFYDATNAKYDPLTWQRPYRGIIGNGIVKNPPSDLGVNTGAVTALGSPNMSVNVDTMQAWMQGFWYRNPAVINLTITAANPSLPRIDRVVLTLSVIGTAPYYTGSITVSVITGTPAASPVAPSLTAMSDTAGQMAIADILVAAAATQITTGNITDDRGTSVCPWAGLKTGLLTTNADGSLSVNGILHSLTDPVSAQDAVTLAYLNAHPSTPSGTFLKKTIYTSGSGNFTSQANTNLIRITLIGAGGAGGGGQNGTSGQTSAGSGGGSGGLLQKTIAVAPSTPYAYSVGTGGTGNLAAAGSPGGNTTMTIGATTYTARGGSGGAIMSPVAYATAQIVLGGGGGAISTNGDVNGAGDSGGQSMNLPYSSAMYMSGKGAACGPWGQGGSGGVNLQANGNAAVGNGSGGGGASTSEAGAATTGGAGANGLIIIDEYT